MTHDIGYNSADDNFLSLLVAIDEEIDTVRPRIDALASFRSRVDAHLYGGGASNARTLPVQRSAYGRTTLNVQRKC